MEPTERTENLQVLIVEDDPMIRRAVTRALRGAGHEVVAVARCGGARSLGRAFDVAVLDLELPDGTGVDMAGELLGVGATEGVVFFSGAADQSLLVRAAQLGEVVAKSGDLGTLLQAVSAAQSEAAVVQRSAQPRPRLARR
jgi:DNA-binding response OmpR family regulator